MNERGLGSIALFFSVGIIIGFSSLLAWGIIRVWDESCPADWPKGYAASSVKNLTKTIRSLLGYQEATGWLSEEVQAIMQEKKGPITFKEKIKNLSLPNWYTIMIGLGCVIALPLPFSWGLSMWNPKVLMLDDKTVIDAFTSLWQVQSAIAAVALPVLLFVIELSKDERRAASRSHEVLIRETHIFPVIIFSLVGTFKIGLDIAWFPTRVVFAIDLLFILFATLLLAMYTYLSALRLIFSPARMKSRGMSVARDKMNESLDASIAIRLGNIRLFEKMDELKVGFWILSARREAERYMVLRAPNTGILVDIHWGKFEEFVRGLPWKEPSLRASVVMSSEPDTEDSSDCSERSKEEYFVWIMKKYGERIYERRDGLIRIDTTAFEALDRIALEARLKSVVKVVSEDEA